MEEGHGEDNALRPRTGVGGAGGAAVDQPQEDSSELWPTLDARGSFVAPGAAAHARVVVSNIDCIGVELPLGASPGKSMAKGVLKTRSAHQPVQAFIARLCTSQIA